MDGWFLTYDVAPLAPRHLLLVTENHWLSARQTLETISVQPIESAIWAVANLTSGAAAFVEHGSAGGTGEGRACIDHAHIHLFPLAHSPSGSDHLSLETALLDLEPDENYLMIGVAGPNGSRVQTIQSNEFPKQVSRAVGAQLVGSEFRKWQAALHSLEAAKWRLSSALLLSEVAESLSLPLMASA